MTDRNRGEYVMHTWTKGPRGLVHEAQVLEDRGNPSEIEEALDPNMVTKARNLKPGDTMTYNGRAWNRFAAKIRIHRIY